MRFLERCFCVFAVTVGFAWHAGKVLAQDHVVLGPGATIAPAYEGARSYRVLPIPILDISYGRVFIDTADGIGIKAIEAGPMTIGGSIGYVPGYRRRDAPAGIGRLSDAAGGRLFASYRKRGFRVLIGATQSIGGTHGMTADGAISYTDKISAHFSLTPSISTTWADGKYNNRYFGVDDQQFVDSGLARSRPESGFRDASFGLGSNYSLSRHWLAVANAGGRRLLGQDARSPIVDRKWGVLGSLGIAYVM